MISLSEVGSKLISEMEDLLCTTRPVDVWRIKQLVLASPGILDEPRLRPRVWAVLLGCDLSSEEEDMAIPEQACDEQVVLEADVRRTRSELEDFRTPVFQTALQAMLQTFCLMHDVAYRQGMHEIAAPFLHMCPPPATRRAYILFEAVLLKYLTRLMLEEDSRFLFKSFRFMHQLLLYHDPELAVHLFNQNHVPELWLPQLILTNFARNVPLQKVFRLWDFQLAVDDPSYLFCIAASLLTENRDPLLKATGPEQLSGLISSLTCFTNADQVSRRAHEIFLKSPEGFLESLRLCCVSRGEQHLFTRADRKQESVRGEVARAGDEAMAKQSVRSCITLSAGEVQAYLSSLEDIGGAEHFIIDLRSASEKAETGIGNVVGAYCLDPHLLETDQATVEIWLEHIDKFKGKHIVILDVPMLRGAASTNLALVRRLLFGEGDGSRKAGELSFSWSPRDRSSRFIESEDLAAEDDSVRSSVRLALIMISKGFNYVSVCDGGLPAIVQHLLNVNGNVRPYVERLDEIKWLRYSKKIFRSGDHLEHQTVRQQLSNLSEDIKCATATAVAERLGHTHMKRELGLRCGGVEAAL